ncbi:Hypothetical protein PBC10988_21470 [Planctomycetales bacterium 10988]|nr:Hypothetical protein PBC10988_21470 [Planctomycetales bacterium 10988]
MSDSHDPADASKSPTPAERASRILEEGLPEDLRDLQLEEQQEILDHCWMDAVLETVLHPDSGAKETRIQRVFAAIEEEKRSQTGAAPLRPVSSDLQPTLPERSVRKWRFPQTFLTATAAIAALLLLSWGLSLLTPGQGPNQPIGLPTRSVQAAINQTLAQVQKPIDRQYRLTFEKKERNVPLPVDELLLYTRGGHQLAFEMELPVVGTVWFGGTPERTWLVPPIGRVLVSNDPFLLKRWLEQRGSDAWEDAEHSMPFLHLETALTRLKERYHLEIVAENVKPQDLGLEPSEESKEAKNTFEELATTEPRWLHIRGIKEDEADRFWPETIDLFTEETTGVAQRMVFHWKPEGRELVLSYLGEGPMPEDWYLHQGHHGAFRRVMEFHQPAE